MKVKSATVLAIFLSLLIVFASTVPVYATHLMKAQPTEDERRMFNKIFARLEQHQRMMPVNVDDVKRSLSESIEIFFSCRSFPGKQMESVSISVQTQLAHFDPVLARQHHVGILSGIYIWDCKAVKEGGTLTIECLNTIMLNPEFMVKEEIENDERKAIAMAENEMVLYHEFLHGELMIDAMKDLNDSTGWQRSACSFFSDNNNELDYGPSDGDHKVISRLEIDYLDKLIRSNDGVLIVKSVDKGNVGTENFRQTVANFDELGALADQGFFIFARTINIEDVKILVSPEERTIGISGYLQNPENDGVARLFVMPKITSANVQIDLSVDDTTKSTGSPFIFNVRVRNLQSTDITGILRLGVDGRIVDNMDADVPANKERTFEFVWKGTDMIGSGHTVRIDGFNTASNEVSVYTYEGLHSRTVNGHGTVSEQSLVTDNNERVLLARPERISAIIMLDDGEHEDNIDIRLMSPDGTSIIGRDGLLKQPAHIASLFNVNDHNLLVKFTEINERLMFLVVKSSLRGQPLPEGEWSIVVNNPDGTPADNKIKYYARYL